MRRRDERPNRRVPRVFNLKTDPDERADITSNAYWDWVLDHVQLHVPAAQIVGQFLQTFVEYPRRQKAASFGVDQVVEKLSQQRREPRR